MSGSALGLAGARRFAAAIAFGVLLASQSLAQAPASDSELDRAYDAAFQELFRDPGNLDKSFRFAELAVRKGNFEAAIGALERMLLIDPDLPRVRLELGVLYFRLGSFEIARGYLQRVLETPNVPPDVRERVQAFLTEINNRMQRSRFSGSASFGYRFSDNANTGPSSTGVFASGVPAELDRQFTNKSDVNYLAAGQINHTYDLLTQNNDLIESSLSLYGSRQRTQRQLDIFFSELTVGVRHPYLQRYIDGASIRPFVLLNWVFLGDSNYQTAWGLGVETTFPWTPRVATTFILDLKREEFTSESDRTNAAGQTGYETGFRVRTTWVVFENLQLSNRLEYTNQTAIEDFNAYSEYLIGFGVTRPFDWKVFIDEPVVISLNGSRSISDYHDVNTSVDSNRLRFDRQWQTGLSGTLPLSESWSAVGLLQRTTTGSNIPNFRYRASSASISLSYRF
jgi:hypothetical protein